MVDKNKTGLLAAFDNHVVRRKVAMDEAGSMEPRHLFPQCLQQRARSPSAPVIRNALGNTTPRARAVTIMPRPVAVSCP